MQKKDKKEGTLTGTAVSSNLRALPSKLVDGGKKWNSGPRSWHAIFGLQVLL